MLKKIRENVLSLRVCNGLEIEFSSKAVVSYGKSIKKALSGMFTLFMGQ